MGLFHDEGTRRWPVSCGSDLISPIPRDYTRIYTCLTKVYEPFETFVYGTGPKSSRSKLEIFFRPAKRSLEELVLERLVKYWNHTPSWRVKNSRVHPITRSRIVCVPTIYIQLKKKILLAKFAKYNNLFSPFLDRGTRVESKISQDSLTFYEGKKFYLNDSTYVSPRFHTRNQKLNIK